MRPADQKVDIQGREADRRLNPFISWMLIAGTSFFDTFALTIIKIRFTKLGMIEEFSLGKMFEYAILFLSSPIVVIAIFAFFLGPFCWFLALNRIKLSIGYPLLVIMHFLFIIIFSTIMLNEEMDQKKFLAMLCIIISLYFFYRAQRNSFLKEKVTNE